LKENGDEAVSADAWSAWFLTLFSTAEFRYLVDIEDQSTNPEQT
jgi:hypothetical protein